MDWSHEDALHLCGDATVSKVGLLRHKTIPAVLQIRKKKKQSLRKDQGLKGSPGSMAEQGLKAGVGTSPWHTGRRAHSIKMDLSFFPRSVKARQVLSDTPEALSRPLGCNSRPAVVSFSCQPGVLCGQCRKRPQVLGGRDGGGGGWGWCGEEEGEGREWARPSAHLCMRSCSSRCLRISGNCFS